MTDSPRSGLALDELSNEIRPQDDLFRYVNGEWIARTEIPEDKARWGSFHLLAEQDESGLLPSGSVRAVDTGMSGPDIGDLQHGQSRPPGTPPTYGLDIEALLTSPIGVGSTTTKPGEHLRRDQASQQVAVPPRNGVRSASSPRAA